MTRRIGQIHRPALAIICLIALAGCQAENSPGDANGHDEDHAGHIIPAHKPKNFPDAVRRLRDLNDQFLHHGDTGESNSSIDPKSVGIALDIANWLPEIAGDSDMPEGPWNEVNMRSARIVADYQEVIAGNASNARRELEQANAEIGHLEKLLLACEPRWFLNTGRVVAP
jgi:hypothetical protein